MILSNALGFWITIGVVIGVLCLIFIVLIFMIVRQAKDPQYKDYYYNDDDEDIGFIIGETTLQEARNSLFKYQEHTAPENPQDTVLITEDYIFYFRKGILIDVYEK